MSAPADGLRAATLALPFEAPTLVEVAPGLSIGAIVAELIAAGIVDAEVAPLIVVFIDDVEIPRAAWSGTIAGEGQLLSLRVRPALAEIAAYAFQVLVHIAISAAVNAVVKAFTPEPLPAPETDIIDISGASNEVARYAPIGVPLGKYRVFPRHAARAYTVPDGEKLYLHVLLCWGLAPLDLDVASLKIGDTPLADFEGVSIQHRLKPTDPWPTLFPNSVDEQEGPGVLLYADPYATRVTDSDDVDRLQVELLFTKGLIFYSGDGGVKGFGVNFWIRYREVGASTWLNFATGAAFNEATDDYDLEGYKKRKPFRMVFDRAVARGKYEVQVRRKSVDDPGPKGMNEFAWSKLRTFTYDPAVTNDHFAVTALRIEAGDQLNGVVDLVNGIVTRRAPIWNAGTESWGAEGPTQNPAELARWIATGPGNPKPRGPDEIDDAAFGAWTELCAAKGWRCDMELRQGAALEEIQQLVARCGRAVLGERAGKLTPIIDDVQPIALQLFTPRNSWGFRSGRRYPREVHAFRIEFANEEKDYERDEMLVFFPGYNESTAELIEAVTSIGKTRPVEVFRDGMRAIAERLLRQEDFSWRADIENLASARGHRVALQHFVMAVGRRSARVTARTLNEAGTHVVALVLDEEIEQTPGDTYGLKWRKVADDTGAVSVETLALTNTGITTNTVTLAATIPLAAAPKVDDLVTFGDGGIETLDVVLQDIVRAGAFEAELTGLRYTSDLFSDDATALPEWSSNVSGGSLPRPPAPIIASARADSTGIFAAYDFPAELAQRVEWVEAYWRQAIDADAAFELVATLPAPLRVAAFPPGEGGVDYEIKLVAAGRAGQRVVRNASAVTTITSAGIGNALVGYLSQPSCVVQTNASGGGGNYGAAGGVFKLFRGDLDVSDGADPDIETSYSVVSASAGLSISINADTGLYTVTDLTADEGEALLRATNNGESVDLTYSISKAKASLTSLGPYNPATTYKRNEWVTYNGGSYLCIVESVTGQAPTGTGQANAYWEVLAAPGAPGEPGTPPSSFTATIDLTSSSSGANLRTIADAAGYTGLSDATITFEVESGVTITGLSGAPNGGIGIDTGTWPTESYTINLTLRVKNGAIVRGGGGRGGGGNSGVGGLGGDAIFWRTPLTLIIDTGAIVQGGGGGGGGGARDRVILSGDPVFIPGGGGGGGQPNGGGGGGAENSDYEMVAGDGTDATTSAIGLGGAGYNAGAGVGGDGGNGGGYGAAGVVGESAYVSGGAFGIGGYCVRKNGHSGSVTNNGTTAGTIA